MPPDLRHSLDSPTRFKQTERNRIRQSVERVRNFSVRQRVFRPLRSTRADCCSFLSKGQTLLASGHPFVRATDGSSAAFNRQQLRATRRQTRRHRRQRHRADTSGLELCDCCRGSAATRADGTGRPAQRTRERRVCGCGGDAPRLGEERLRREPSARRVDAVPADAPARGAVVPAGRRGLRRSVRRVDVAFDVRVRPHDERDARAAQRRARSQDAREGAARSRAVRIRRQFEAESSSQQVGAAAGAVRRSRTQQTGDRRSAQRSGFEGTLLVLEHNFRNSNTFSFE